MVTGGYFHVSNMPRFYFRLKISLNGLNDRRLFIDQSTCTHNDEKYLNIYLNRFKKSVGADLVNIFIYKSGRSLVSLPY